MMHGRWWAMPTLQDVRIPEHGKAGLARQKLSKKGG